MICVRRRRPRRASSAWDVTAPVRRSSSKWMARARSLVTRGSRPTGGGSGGLTGLTRRRPWLVQVTDQLRPPSHVQLAVSRASHRARIVVYFAF